MLYITIQILKHMMNFYAELASGEIVNIKLNENNTFKDIIDKINENLDSECKICDIPEKFKKIKPQHLFKTLTLK